MRAFLLVKLEPCIGSLSHVLLLLVKVPLVVFLYYCLYVDVPLPLSQLVSFSSNDVRYKGQQ